MLKNALAVFIGVVLAGVALFFMYGAYVDFKLTQVAIAVASEIEKDAQEQAESVALVRQLDADNSLKFCLLAANKQHGKTVDLLNVVKKTEDFAAINYTVSGQQYHGRCTFRYQTNEVASFDFSAL